MRYCKKVGNKKKLLYDKLDIENTTLFLDTTTIT